MSASPARSPLSETFDLLRKKLRRFEPRPSQLRMAEAVERAFSEPSHLAVEAPCGIGKTFAYLIPAILHAQREEESVVIATANIALQEQLVEKDLPALAKALPQKFSFALIKGLNNYLCLDRHRQASREVLLDPAHRRQFERITRWSGETAGGDRSDLPFEPAEPVWSSVQGVPELCTGRKCTDYEPCFAMKARRRLPGTTVIVCNYHLLFAHLKIKMLSEKDLILPPIHRLVCDEAHEMADVAREFFGARLSPRSIHHLLRGARSLGLDRAAERVHKASSSYFDDLERWMRGRGPVVRLRAPSFADGSDLQNAVSSLARDLDSLAKGAPDETTSDQVAKSRGAADHYRQTLEGFLRVDDGNTVYWASRDTRGAVRLHSKLIDVGPILKETLFDSIPSVVLTSATLAAGNSFEFLRLQVGLEKTRELQVPSPFDLPAQSLLVVPEMKHAPNEDGFRAELSDSINRIVQHLQGRTLCLFTSHRNLQFCADRAQSTGVKILRQGEQPRSRLLREFRKDKGTALFAAASFWQGVDIPGKALSCLLIDRIPFLPPDDPFLSALQERDDRTFRNFSLPRAILDLRQGFGRLIRRKDDRGVVVIFDRRLRTARYGSAILRSLPPVPVRTKLEAIFEFLNAPQE